MAAILQRQLPHAPPTGRLPGIAPLRPEDWLQWDDAFGGQMQLRDTLLSSRRADVLRLDEAARPAAEELLETVLNVVSGRADYRLAGQDVVRPDGVAVRIRPEDPLATLGRLVQEDFCILQKPENATEHVLTGAVLCFPAGWTLSEKFMRPLAAIHGPVAEYDENLAPRVQRLFDAIRPQQPLWRTNWLIYENPDLFAPRLENDPRPATSGRGGYIRSERQCLVRLPGTGAVVFSIHTFMVRRSVGNDG